MDISRRQFVTKLAVGSAVLATGGLATQEANAKECTYWEMSDLFEDNRPMDFRNYLIGFQVWKPKPRIEGTNVIMMNGEIVTGSTEAFRKFLRENQYPAGTTVYLNSTGGDLDEGLDLGKLIRERKFNTAIGTTRSKTFGMDWTEGPAPAGGACMSACTFTFLGGVERRMHVDDIFGVHRFSAKKDQGMDVAQQETGKLLAYVESMGVKSRLIEDMAKVGPEKFNRLLPNRLKELNVITSTKWLDGAQNKEYSCE